MDRIVLCLQWTLCHSKGNMNVAFTDLAIQKRQTNLFQTVITDKDYYVTVYRFDT